MGEQDLDTTADWNDDPAIEELGDDDLEQVAGGWTEGDGG